MHRPLSGAWLTAYRSDTTLTFKSIAKNDITSNYYIKKDLHILQILFIALYLAAEIGFSYIFAGGELFGIAR